jgi:hypothetical protein
LRASFGIGKAQRMHALGGNSMAAQSIRELDEARRF